ncbi:hypothetical protein IVA74_35625 [Bradyrhizobium sp. 132]|nr:hypothetical protein [Bradyrhizobium sp. 132]
MAILRGFRQNAVHLRICAPVSRPDAAFYPAKGAGRNRFLAAKFRAACVANSGYVAATERSFVFRKSNYLVILIGGFDGR